MTFKAYISFMIGATALCWSTFIMTLLFIDPFKTNYLGILIFYISLFLSLVGSFALIGLLIRIFLLKGEQLFRLVPEAFRQAITLSGVIIFALFFQSKNLLTWWNIIILIAVFGILEMFFYSYKENKMGKSVSNETQNTE